MHVGNWQHAPQHEHAPRDAHHPSKFVLTPPCPLRSVPRLGTGDTSVGWCIGIWCQGPQPPVGMSVVGSGLKATAFLEVVGGIIWSASKQSVTVMSWSSSESIGSLSRLSIDVYAARCRSRFTSKVSTARRCRINLSLSLSLSRSRSHSTMA